MVEILLSIFVAAVISNEAKYSQCEAMYFEGPHCQSELEEYKTKEEYTYCVDKDFKGKYCKMAKEIHKESYDY